MRVFIDTSAFIALIVKTERRHKEIFEQYKQYSAENTFFYTNYFVINELYTRLAYDLSSPQLKKLVQETQNLLRKQFIQLLTIDPILFRKAETYLIKFCEHKISFTDVIIYTTVKELKLDEVFTIDSDFKKIGLKTNPV